MNALRVAIVGATGYAGTELTVLLAGHPQVELVGVYSGGSGATGPLVSLDHRLRGARGPQLEAFDFDRLAAANPEVVFLATPNESSATLVPRILELGCRVIDLSGAYRLQEPSAYPEWYGFDHPAPALLEHSVYGLPEWSDGALPAAQLVANPGCYPTAIVLALRPLVYLIDREQAVICDAKSGVSGAGKRSEVAFSFAELAGNFKAYSVGHHRHEPELRAALDLGSRTPFVFVPHLLPTVRGILATIHVGFDRVVKAEELTSLFDAAYAHSPFVQVLPGGELPEMRNVVQTPRAEIGFVLLNGGRRAVIVSVIDNLLKGAASQAVQNFNLMHQFAETEGLAA